jgi:hypothetical protein
MSVFILAGDSLKADTSFEGPFAPMDVDSGADLMEAIDKFETSRSKLPLSFRKLVDFEHLNDAETFTTSNSMDDDEPIDPDDPDAADKRKERRQKRREKQLDMKRRKEQKRIERQRDMRDDGDPFERTTKAPESGWYRVCVHATFNLVRDHVVIVTKKPQMSIFRNKERLMITNTFFIYPSGHCRI